MREASAKDNNVIMGMAPDVGLKSPPLLPEDVCLKLGEPIVRIENALGDAVRIFTGLDVAASLESVWDVLTNYEQLQVVVPSLVQNDVLERYAGGGARIAQIGSATVYGVRATAKI